MGAAGVVFDLDLDLVFTGDGLISTILGILFFMKLSEVSDGAVDIFLFLPILLVSQGFFLAFTEDLMSATSVKSDSSLDFFEDGLSRLTLRQGMTYSVFLHFPFFVPIQLGQTHVRFLTSKIPASPVLRTLCKSRVCLLGYHQICRCLVCRST